MRLTPVATRAERDALLSGDLGGLSAAPGWPHEDTQPGMSFLDCGGLVFLILDDDERIAGECGTKTPPRSDGSVEIGYGLAPSSRGRGLGAAAVGALVATLAMQREITTIEAEVHVGNVASSRVVERLGFATSSEPANGYLRHRLDVTEGSLSAS